MQDYMNVGGFMMCHYCYVDITGDLNAGLMLDRILYWFSPGKDGKPRAKVVSGGNLWIVKQHNEWGDELRMTYRQVKRAMKILVDKHLIIKEIRWLNCVRATHIRPNFEEIDKQLDIWRTNHPMMEEVENTEIEENEPSVPNVQNVHPEMYKRDINLVQNVHPQGTKGTSRNVQNVHPQGTKGTSAEYERYICKCTKGTSLLTNKELNKELNKDLNKNNNKGQAPSTPSGDSPRETKEPKPKKETVRSLIDEYAGDNEEMKAALDSFVEMRTKMKKPLTARAMKIDLNKLDNLSEGDKIKAIAIVDQSNCNNWQGFYELKDDGHTFQRQKKRIHLPY